MAEIISEVGYVMVSPSNTAPWLTDPDQSRQPGYLRTSHNDRIQGQAMAKYAIDELGVTTATAIHDRDPYTEYLARAFADEFKILGGTITSFMAVNKGDNDLTPVLGLIAADSPAFLYYPLFTTEGSLITTQAREIPAFDDTILAAVDGMISDAAVKAVGEAGEGMYFSGPDLSFGGNTYDKFLAAYKEKYGTSPISVFHAHAFDATNMIFACLEQDGIDDSGTLVVGRQALRDCLYDTENFPGITGRLTCDEFGDCGAADFSISHLQDGEYVRIWP